MCRKLILLMCIVQLSFCQYFNNIPIRIIKNDQAIALILADKIEADEGITEIQIQPTDSDAVVDIPILKKGSFQNLTELKYISILETNLNETEQGVFDNLPKLRVIKLNFNQLTTIYGGVFNFLTVTKICLIGNYIYDIKETAFNNITYLEILDLSRNNLEYLPSTMFAGTRSLRQLNLSFNKLTYISPDLFEEAFSNVYKGQHSFIDLSYNQFVTLNSNAFAGVTCVESLFLNNNNLEHLGVQILTEFTCLDVINLEGNYLTSLSNDILHKLSYASEINLSSNPWTCGFVKKYDSLCIQHMKDNTMDQAILEECKNRTN